MKVCTLHIRVAIAAFLLLLAQTGIGLGQGEVKVREFGALRLENVPEIPASVFEELARYHDTTHARLLDWSDEGDMLISARRDELSQLFTLSAPGAEPRQLTLADQRVQRGAFAKSDGEKGIIFSRDQDGDENFQFYFKPLDNGTARQLTDERGRNSNAVLSPDERRIAYTRAQDGVGEPWGIIITTIKDGSSRILFQDPGAWAVLDWSRDGRWLLVLRFTSIHDSTLFVVDIETGVKMPIDVQDMRGGYSRVRFSADNRGVYVISNALGEFMSLRYVGFDGEARDISTDIPWNVTDFDVSGDGRFMAFTVNKGGLFQLHILHAESGKTAFTPTLPRGQITDLNFDPNSRYLGFTMDAAKFGQGIYALDLGSGEVERWDSFGVEIPENTVDPDLIHYPTFDDVGGKPRQIPALIYRPTEPGPHPVVIRLHGGPESQWVAGYSETTQHWVGALGVAVIKPNIRGSTGYGRDFAALDNDLRREDAVKDIGALLDWIATQDDLDDSRIMVQGGSYGGYLALASLVHYGPRLRGAIDVVGISNFVTFLEQTSSFRRDLRRVEYGDESDPEMRAFLNAISPLTYAHTIDRPLLIAQGANDPRVPKNESDQMVDAIRANNGDVWYILAGDEGHGFARRSNVDILNAASALFIRRYLLGEDTLATIQR